MATFREILADVKSQILETSTAAAEERLGEAVFLDVREADEHDQGALPGAIHIPRGFLESQIESRITDRDAPIVVYCSNAACSNSRIVARRLERLGYSDVRRYEEGKDDWINAGLPVEHGAVPTT
jgi:rhodanese-related sulfurtransferase